MVSGLRRNCGADKPALGKHFFMCVGWGGWTFAGQVMGAAWTERGELRGGIRQQSATFRGGIFFVDGKRDESPRGGTLRSSHVRRRDLMRCLVGRGRKNSSSFGG